MHIWMVNHYAIAASQAGGTRHYSLARALIARGHDVTVIASDVLHTAGAGAQAGAHRRGIVDEDGVRFVWISTPPYAANGLARLRNMLSFAVSVWRERPLRSAPKPDVILGSSPHPFAALSAMLVARRRKVPFVLELRDLWPDSLVKVAGVSPWHPLVVMLRQVERVLYRSADAIVTLLPNAEAFIVARGGSSERIAWVPNGVDLSLAADVRPREAGAPFTVAYAGSHGQANGLDSLLDAARLLRDDCNPRIHFRFIGAGSEKSRLKAAAQAEGLTHVRFDEPLPKQEVPAALQDADVLVATTRNIDLYAHGLSFNKLFDYLAAGRPVVFGASSPGNPIERSGGGVVVPPEDSAAIAQAIRRLAALSPGEREAMGLRGRRYAEEHYDIRKLAARLEAVLLLGMQHRRELLTHRPETTA